MELKGLWMKVLVAAVIMVLLSPVFAYACELTGYAEPLERSAEIVGVEERPMYEAPMPDYLIPGVEVEAVSGILAGLVGTALVAVVALVLGRALRAGRG